MRDLEGGAQRGEGGWLSLFLWGRSLLHSAMITNEVVDEVRRKKRKCLIFKVDYEKAYNSMCWKFLL